MPDLEIKIRTTAEGDGVQQTADDLKKLQPAAQEAGKAVQDLDFKKKDLRATLKALRHEVPELGVVLRYLTSPFAGIAAAATLAYQALKTFFDNLKKQEQEAQAFERITESMGKFKAMLQESKDQAAAFATSLKDIATQAENAATKLAAFVKEQQKQNRRTSEKENRQKALELAQIDEAEEAGKLTPSQAIRARAAVEEKYAKLARKHEQDALITQITATGQTITESEGEETSLQGQLGAARQTTLERAKVAKAARKEANDIANQTPEKVKALDEKIGKLRKVQEDWERLTPEERRYTRSDLGADARQQREDLESQRDQLVNTQENAEAVATHWENLAKQASEAEKKLEADITRTAGAIQQLKKDLADLWKDWHASVAHGDEISKIEGQERDIRTRIAVTKEKKEEGQRLGHLREQYQKDVRHAVETGAPIPPPPDELGRLEGFQKRDAASEAPRQSGYPPASMWRGRLPLGDNDAIQSAGAAVTSAVKENARVTIETFQSLTNEIRKLNVNMDKAKQDIERGKNGAFSGR